jgi:hypothetical protein
MHLRQQRRQLLKAVLPLRPSGALPNVVIFSAFHAVIVRCIHRIVKVTTRVICLTLALQTADISSSRLQLKYRCLSERGF